MPLIPFVEDSLLTKFRNIQQDSFIYERLVDYFSFKRKNITFENNTADANNNGDKDKTTKVSFQPLMKPVHNKYAVTDMNDESKELTDNQSGKERRSKLCC